MCLSTVASAVTQHEMGVVYIDTGNAFTAKRLLEICSYRYSNNDQVCEHMLKLVKCSSVYDPFAFLSILEIVKKGLDSIHSECGIRHKDNFFSNLGLIVVDSLYSLVSPILCSKAKGHALMAAIVWTLKVIARKFNIAVLVTNSCTLDKDSSDKSTQILKSALGKTWSFYPSVQMFLDVCEEKEGVNYCVGELRKSCRKVWLVLAYVFFGSVIKMID